MATPPGFVPTPAPATGAPAAPPPVLPIGDPPSVQERINALNERIRIAEAAAGEVATLRQRAILAERRADSAAHPSLRHPDVSAHVSAQYDAYAARTGDAAKSYAEWLSSDGATNPLVSPYLTVAAPPPVPGTPPPVAPPPVPGAPNAGVVQLGGPPPVTAYTSEAVAAMSLQQVAANLDGILKAGADAGEFRYTPPKARALTP